MRARERSLPESLRRIVLAALAPSVAAGGACRASSSDPGAGAGALDASIAEDANAPATDGAPPGDDGGAAIDAAACAPSPVDGATLGEFPDGCADFHALPCGLPPEARLEGCLIDLGTCAAQCGPAPVYYCQLAPIGCDPEAGILPASPTIVDCVRCGSAGGRRPLGLRAASAPCRSRPSPLGDLFASMAHLESASVRAFRDLERWLGEHGAPPRLARAARRAAGDERRHARAASRLARRFGAAPPRVSVAAVATPSLRALLEDDAVEGCVGETWGALLAAWQAERAADPRVRRTLRRIAADEARHAALAWAILRWGAPRLAPGDRRRVGRALDRALRDLARPEKTPASAIERHVAGLPSPAERRRLVVPLAQLIRDGARGSVMLARPRVEQTRS